MRLILVCIIIVLSVPSYSQSKKELQAEVNSLKAQIAELKKPVEVDTTDIHKKVSYGLGVLVAKNLIMQGGDSLDVEILNAGITDAFKDKPLKIEQEKSAMIVQQYMQQAMEKKATKKREESKVFLEENKKKEGVTVTSSGLQYKVVSTGKGKMPAATDNVTVQYTGKLVDGTVFDSSVKRGEPATFVVNQVIPGWTEALQLMHEGDKWELVIPSDLGYGAQGAGGQIPPNST
ncbi:MAG TPA: FKBP-type peptidyl-prolyl cis-trans isomerase, partial [Chryseolinea sp.]|nr:FKBP-type peptidyl-prolyl cis-trans isomerase [Chryseolinea sp.]